MTRLALLAALFLAACGPNTSLGLHITQDENDPPRAETPRAETPRDKFPPDLGPPDCLGYGPGCGGA
jgi:hypothetical protein